MRAALAGAGLAQAVAVHAQVSGRVPRLGYLWIGPPGSDGDTLRGLKQGLLDLHYVEGKTILIDYRYADGDPARLPALVRELVASHIDLLLVAGSQSALAAKADAGDVPIVGTTGDPVELGLAASIGRPGGNYTGLSTATNDFIAAKVLDLLVATVPWARRVGFLTNNAINIDQLRRARATAVALRIELIVFDVPSTARLQGAFDEIAAAQLDALVVNSDPLFGANMLRIIEFARAQRLPTIYRGAEFVKNGGLMSYGHNIYTMWRRAMVLADHILKGAKPADLPIELPTSFELRLNLQTTKELGLIIPLDVLARADEVIE